MIGAVMAAIGEGERYWDTAYAERGVEGVSWYQADARVSLELIGALDIARDGAVVDVGGGAYLLADQRVERGFADVSVLDLSAGALAAAQRRAGPSSVIHWLHEDLLTWRPVQR